MTNNAWNTPTLEDAGDGYTMIGSGSGRPAAALITGDSNVTITPGANTLEISSAASGGDLVKIGTSSASTSASITFTGLSSTYHLYILRFSNLQPDTNSTTLIFRTSTNNGISYDSGASDYAWSLWQANESGNGSGDADQKDSSITLAGVAGGAAQLGTGSNELAAGYVYIFNPSATNYTHIFASVTYFNEATQLITNSASGHRASAADVDAIQILMDSGNLSTGDFTLYGVSNA